MRMAMAAVLVAFTSGVATAQTPDERIEAAMAKAAEGGIPVAMLQDKVAEGRAKGIPMDRIAAAVEQRAAGLARAQQALGSRPDVSDADLVAAADALQSGVSETVLQTVSDLAPRDRRAVAIAALEWLVQEGRTPQQALDQVRAALGRGPEALLNINPTAGAVGRAPVTIPAGPPSSVPAPGQAPQGGRPAGLPIP